MVASRIGSRRVHFDWFIRFDKTKTSVLERGSERGPDGSFRGWVDDNVRRFNWSNARVSFARVRTHVFRFGELVDIGGVFRRLPRRAAERPLFGATSVKVSKWNSNGGVHTSRVCVTE